MISKQIIIVSKAFRLAGCEYYLYVIKIIQKN